jgi:hypothetical protein
MPNITNLADVILSVLLIPIILYLWERRFRWRIPMFELNIDEFSRSLIITVGYRMFGYNKGMVSESTLSGFSKNLMSR